MRQKVLEGAAWTISHGFVTGVPRAGFTRRCVRWSRELAWWYGRRPGGSRFGQDKS